MDNHSEDLNNDSIILPPDCWSDNLNDNDDNEKINNFKFKINCINIDKTFYNYDELFNYISNNVSYNGYSYNFIILKSNYKVNFVMKSIKNIVDSIYNHFIIKKN
jgi:hypothetical protein